MTLIISKNGKEAKKIEKTIINQEEYLQKYIYNNPEVIPLYEIKEDIRVCILARELPTNSGPIDALGIDKDGEIYIIETKLYKNPDKRLVVAQILDYGASLWRNNANFGDFISFFEKESLEKFSVSLNQRLKDFFQLTDEEISILLENFRKNLSEGNFKFVVLMDKLHSQLKDLIAFINQNSQFDIFAVELEYYKYEDYEILIPKLFGAEVKKDIGTQTSTSQRRKWNEEEFFNEVNSKLEKKYAEAIKKLYDFSKQKSDEIAWGTGPIRGSFNPKFYKVSTRSPFSVFTDGKLGINFGWLNDTEQTRKIRNLLLEKLSKVINFPIPKQEDLDHFYLPIPIEKWYSHVEEFIKIIKEIIK